MFLKAKLVKALGPIKIQSGLERGSRFFLQARSEAALRPPSSFDVSGSPWHPHGPRHKPSSAPPKRVCFTAPARSLQLCKPGKGFCPALIFAWINSCPPSLNPVPQPLCLLDFSIFWSLQHCVGAFQQHPPQPWCRIWKKHLKPILCRNLLRSDFYLMPKDTPFKFFPRGNLTPSGRLRV